MHTISIRTMKCYNCSFYPLLDWIVSELRAVNSKASIYLLVIFLFKHFHLLLSRFLLILLFHLLFIFSIIQIYGNAIRKSEKIDESALVDWLCQLLQKLPNWMWHIFIHSEQLHFMTEKCSCTRIPLLLPLRWALLALHEHEREHEHEHEHF